ncbi:hypothetical protein INR49_031039 [Caranx melampygus]|nr:hypothetical protein INR49_031039 [Caranx melampygus]
MFLTRSEYDRGVNTFSPEGRLFQVEYAIEAIKLGSTAIGIQTSEGVCLAVEKRITSPLMEPNSIEKIVEIDSHIGCAMSGLIADAKTLIDKARVETQNHWFTYNETMTVESVTQAVSNLALQFGEEDADPGAMSRPFGVALLFGGVDEKGPQLYHMDPSGTFVQCDARAIGSASEGAQSSLQEVYHKSMTLKDAIKSSLTILKQVMEEKLNATNIELATVEPGKTFHMYSKEELEDESDQRLRLSGTRNLGLGGRGSGCFFVTNQYYDKTVVFKQGAVFVCFFLCVHNPLLHNMHMKSRHPLPAVLLQTHTIVLMGAVSHQKTFDISIEEDSPPTNEIAGYSGPDQSGATVEGP